MPATATFTVDNLGNPEPVVVPVFCRRATIREQGAAGTTDYIIHRPIATSPGYKKVSGESFTFSAEPGAFEAGQTIGYVETLTGTITMSLECE